MENKIKRPLLLSGLILNLVAYIFLAISCIIMIIASAGFVADADISGVEGALILIFAVYILIFLMTIAGIVLSSVSFTRLNMDEETYSKKKGVLIGCFVLDCITVIFLLIGICSTFSVENFLLMLALIAAAALIMVEYVLSRKAKTAQNTETVSAEIETPQSQEETSIAEEEKVEESLVEDKEEPKE